MDDGWNFDRSDIHIRNSNGEWRYERIEIVRSPFPTDKGFRPYFKWDTSQISMMRLMIFPRQWADRRLRAAMECWRRIALVI